MFARPKGKKSTEYSKLNSVWSNPRHPVYSIVKIPLAAGILAIILAFSANRFDQTEIETIGWFFLIFGGIQGSHEIIKKFGGAS